jgi:hypothetical protein
MTHSGSLKIIKIISFLLLVLMMLFFTKSSFSADVVPPVDAQIIKEKMERIIAYLDSPEYSSMVTLDQHVVQTYRMAQGRFPTAVEAFVLRRLHQDIKLKHSTMLLIALRGDQEATTWEQCRRFINRFGILHFMPNDVARAKAKELTQNIRSEVAKEVVKSLQRLQKNSFSIDPQVSLLSNTVAKETYIVYYGYLHAHSSLSDGVGDPEDAYLTAKQAGLDFFALTDHGEALLVWPWEESKWQKLVTAAENTNDSGTYVTLWGFEWSNAIFGHINILNTGDFTNAIFTVGLFDVYDWIVDRPTAIGRFNHPGEYDDFGLEFLHFWPYEPVRSQMIGIETWNGNDSFETYVDEGGYFSQRSFLDEGNRFGWLLGALGGQDNHSANWGTRNDFRTAVLAKELTRESILDAYRSRRFYATEDNDLELDMRVQGFPMGSILEGVQRQIDVSACDGSSDTFDKVHLYRSGNLIQTIDVTSAGSCIEVSFDDSSYPWPAYYYIRIQQSDADEAMSSSIWIRE